MIAGTVFLVGTSYMLGSIPFAYVAARYYRGIDIRDYGSGNVGTSNLIKHGGTWIGITVGTIDTLVKGAMPVVLTGVLGFGINAQLAVGIASIAGHNWSVYIRMTGGRGLAVSIGVVLALSLWFELFIGLVFIGLLGRVIARDTALWALLAFLLIPLVAVLIGRPTLVVYALVVITLLLISKRLTSNWESLPSSTHGLIKVLICRLLWDRDLWNKDDWTNREPRRVQKD